VPEGYPRRLQGGHLQLHGGNSGLHLHVRGRRVRALRGLFDVPTRLRSLRANDHHHHDHHHSLLSAGDRFLLRRGGLRVGWFTGLPPRSSALSAGHDLRPDHVQLHG
jgi:hypothetical protein